LEQIKLDKNFVKNSFEFKSTNETFVSKVIDKFNVKKATGVDKIFVCQIDETW
jgi:hypothetical protein